ncbi:MAG TPA: peptidase S41, partial [Bacteroidetes bacterium]|nr:peptidase S41 [Bacteroidota bacterium]
EAKKEEKAIKIDFAGIEDRMEILPVKAGNLGQLTAVDGKLIFMRYPNRGERNGKATLNYYDFKSRKTKKIIEGVNGYDVTADGKSIMVLKGRDAGIIKIAENQKLNKKVDFSNMNMNINPREEWHQIFREVWRLERDYFYDKNMHGVDWNKMYKVYSPLIDQCVTRYDVNFVIGQLLGEMNASHTYKGGGDQEYSPSKRIGCLGINWAKDGDLYKVAHIVKPASWETEVKSPLIQSGIEIEEGDYIFAVNGKNLSDFNNPYEAFLNLAGKTVELLYGKEKDISKSKTALVKTLSSETRLRNLEWIEKHRKRVEEATNGRVGYIYVPSTGLDGQRELARQFYGQWNKDALIIDERWNNGGQIPDRFIELLNRKPLNYVASRAGKLWQVPRKANFGPKVMLINGWSGSGGDAFPDYFKKTKLGELIGTRTWGGLIGISGAPRLIDGGYITVPTFRLMDPDGKWFREGYGVDPDIEVNEDPTLMAKGIDPQLETAIDVLNKKLKNIKSLHPKRPPREDRSK